MNFNTDLYYYKETQKITRTQNLHSCTVQGKAGERCKSGAPAAGIIPTFSRTSTEILRNGEIKKIKAKKRKTLRSKMSPLGQA